MITAHILKDTPVHC